MSYTRVSKLHPCPVCKKPDWCRVFADGWVECMRVQSGCPAKSGGWMHSQRELSPGPVRFSPPPTRVAVPIINATKLHREWLAATTPTQLAEFAAALGLSVAALVSANAAWAAPHGAWAFPMCDGHGNIVGIRLRRPDGAKFAVRGSRQGIFMSAECGVRIAERQEVLFVCEGPTDTAAAVDLGLFAVGRPNCCCGGPEIKVFARLHQCNRVVMISDNDKPGLDGAAKVGAEIGLPFAIYVPPAKDLREFVRLGGTRAMIENTLKGTIWRNG
jgi:hypothetical protein